MASIMALRASRTGLQAEVRIGVADDGNYVTVNVKLDRIKNDALAEALAPLEKFLLAYAEERTSNAATEGQVLARAKLLSKVQVQAANDRSQQIAVELATQLGLELEQLAKVEDWVSRNALAAAPGSPQATRPNPWLAISRATKDFREKHAKNQRREAG